MPRLNDRESNVQQWKRDQDQWAHHGFKVLGVEIGHLPVHQQVAILAGGVFFFLLIYGYMQVSADWPRFGCDTEAAERQDWRHYMCRVDCC